MIGSNYKPVFLLEAANPAHLKHIHELMLAGHRTVGANLFLVNHLKDLFLRYSIWEPFPYARFTNSIQTVYIIITC